MAAAAATASVATITMDRTMSCASTLVVIFAIAFATAFAMAFAMAFTAAAVVAFVAAAAVTSLTQRLLFFDCSYGYGFGCVRDYG